MHCSQEISASGGCRRIRRAMLCVLICSGALLNPGCGGEKSEPVSIPEVEVADAVKKDVSIPKEWVGVTDGMVDASIRAQVTGYLIRQDYKDGGFVKKDEVLFEIDPRPFQAVLNQAQAQLGQEEALHTNAKVNLDRLRPLASQNVVSMSDLDNAIAQERSTMSAVLAAKAAVEKAVLDLSFTRISSPIDGVAGFAQAQVGDLVGPTQIGLLTTISTIDPIRMYINLSEEDYFYYVDNFHIMDRTKKDSEKLDSEMILSDGTLYPHKGCFYALDRQVDLKTGTLQLALAFPNPDGLLRPGMFVRARISEMIIGAIIIPRESVMELQGSSQVAVLGAGNRVEMRAVKAGGSSGGFRVIVEGLKAGERVIAAGIMKVNQGTLVAPRPYSGGSESQVNVSSQADPHPESVGR